MNMASVSAGASLRLPLGSSLAGVFCAVLGVGRFLMLCESSLVVTIMSSGLCSLSMSIGCLFSVAAMAVAICFLCLRAVLSVAGMFSALKFSGALSCGSLHYAVHLHSVLRLFFSFHRLLDHVCVLGAHMEVRHR